VSVWLLGGLDPTGGAGVLRDFSTASTVAPSRSVVCVVTAWTRQGYGVPAQAEPVEPVRIEAQLAGLEPPRAVKIGLVPAALVDVVLRVLEPLDAPVVLDPVLRASDGGALGSTPEALVPLVRRATLVTPNRHEADRLTAGSTVSDPLEALAARFPETGLLLKGGHFGEPDRVVDRLWYGGRTRAFDRPRVPGPDPRGTGCALATAIACGLAGGESLEQAVASAIAWLDRARVHAVRRGDVVHLPMG
jgi:hydroxymethylpyrimidine/phosphomethylpyrimidine kinase